MNNNTSLQRAHEKHWEGRPVDNSGNFQRNKLIKKYFSKVDKEVTILDLACGNGDNTEYLVDSGFNNVYSVDFSNKGAEITRERGGKNVIQADICDPLPYENNFFDYILWLDNIEHLYSPQAAIDNVNKFLKKDGVLLVSLPNMGYWLYRLYYLKNGTIIGTDGVLPDGHINLPWEFQHIRFFNEKYIRMFLEKNDFGIVKFLSYNNLSEFKNKICVLYRRILADGFLIISQKL